MRPEYINTLNLLQSVIRNRAEVNDLTDAEVSRLISKVRKQSSDDSTAKDVSDIVIFESLLKGFRMANQYRFSEWINAGGQMLCDTIHQDDEHSLIVKLTYKV